MNNIFSIYQCITSHFTLVRTKLIPPPLLENKIQSILKLKDFIIVFYHFRSISSKLLLLVFHLEKLKIKEKKSKNEKNSKGPSKHICSVLLRVKF